MLTPEPTFWPQGQGSHVKKPHEQQIKVNGWKCDRCTWIGWKENDEIDRKQVKCHESSVNKTTSTYHNQKKISKENDTECDEGETKQTESPVHRMTPERVNSTESLNKRCAAILITEEHQLDILSSNLNNNSTVKQGRKVFFYIGEKSLIVLKIKTNKQDENQNS